MTVIGHLPSIWPPGSASSASTVLCCRAACSAEQLFKTIFTTAELQAAFHKLRNDSNYAETAWLAAREELPAQQFTWDPPATFSGSSVSTHRWRKVRFESPPSAMASKPFQNEELQCCLDYSLHHRYVVETQANTTAPYGTSFNVFLRLTICAAEGSSSSSILHVGYFTEFLPSMSRMLKPVVSKGVEGGVKGTYKQLRQALDTFHKCEDVDEAEFNKANAAAMAAAAAATTHDHAPPPVASLHTESSHALPSPVPVAVARSLPVEAPAPPYKPASFLDFFMNQTVYPGQVSAVSNMMNVGTERVNTQGMPARVLSLVLTLACINLVMSVIKTVKGICDARQGYMFAFCFPLYLIDLPDNTVEVVASLAIVALVNWAIVKGSELSMPHLNSMSQAAGTAAEPAAPVPASVSLSSPEAQGAAASSAAAHGAAAAPAAAEAPAKPRKAAPPARPHPMAPPPPRNATARNGSSPTGMEMAALGGGSRSTTTPMPPVFTPPAVITVSKNTGNTPTAAAGGSPQAQTGAAASAADAPAGRARSASPALGHTAPSGEEGITSPSRVAANGGTAEESGSSLIDIFKVAFSRANVKPSAPTSGDEKSAPGSPRAGGQNLATAASNGLQPGTSAKPHEPVIIGGGQPHPAHLLSALIQGEEEDDVVVEELFENERFQPFRGWGHTWPGHFLPSDRVGRWSDRSGGPGGQASMVFDQVAPRLPYKTAWKWVESEWQLDLNGVDKECVDSDGWAYALDFPYLKWPPAPGTGKCTMNKFVRRRRLYRTRVRIEPRQGKPQHSNSASMELGTAAVVESVQPPGATDGMQMAPGPVGMARADGSGTLSKADSGVTTAVVASTSPAAAAGAAGGAASKGVAAASGAGAGGEAAGGGAHLDELVSVVATAVASPRGSQPGGPSGSGGPIEAPPQGEQGAAAKSVPAASPAPASAQAAKRPTRGDPLGAVSHLPGEASSGGVSLEGSSGGAAAANPAAGAAPTEQGGGASSSPGQDAAAAASTPVAQGGQQVKALAGNGGASAGTKASPPAAAPTAAAGPQQPPSSSQASSSAPPLARESPSPLAGEPPRTLLTSPAGAAASARSVSPSGSMESSSRPAGQQDRRQKLEQMGFGALAAMLMEGEPNLMDPDRADDQD